MLSSTLHATARTLPRVAGAVPRAALLLPRNIRRWTIAGIVLAALFTGVYYAWFRDSSLVRVQQVEVTGLTSADAARVRAALVNEARGMTTLHMRPERLAAAVSGFSVVRSLEVSAKFPHKLVIHVIQRQAAALLHSPEGTAIVAGDGTVLHGVNPGSLPVLDLPGTLPSRHLTAASEPGRALSVAAAAPPALLPRVESVTEEPGDGFVAALRNGPKIVFGSLDRAEAKWAAAAAVLANPSSKGATYVDVRLPERPVAGGLAAATVAPVLPPAGSASTATASDGSAAAPPSAPQAQQTSPATAQTPAQSTPPQSQTAPSTGQPAAPQQQQPAAGQGAAGGGVAAP